MFPEDARSIDAAMRSDDWDPDDAPYIWIEKFSQRTTDAVKGERDQKAERHLAFMSRMLDTADEETRRAIDVAYVESLLWDVKDGKRKAEGWKLIPPNLQELYISMWGTKPFMGKRK